MSKAYGIFRPSFLRTPRLIASACLLALATVAAHPACAQAAGQKAEAAEPVPQVTLPVVLHDKKNKPLRTLTKDDFTLQIDGHPQPIAFYTQDLTLAMNLGVVVDTSMSQASVLANVRNSTKPFLGKVMPGAKDQAFLLHFDRQVELLEDLTTSREKLEASLELLQTPQLKTADAEGDDNADDHAARGGSKQLYDAIFLGADDVLKKQKGRRVLVVLSDGVDRGSKENLTEAIEAAQRANVTIYAVYLKGAGLDRGTASRNPLGNGGGRPRVGMGGGGWPGSSGGGQRPGNGGGQRLPQIETVDGRKILTRIAEETGGRMLEVTKKQSLDEALQAISDDLAAQYSLIFSPVPDAAGSGYHRVNLSSDKKDVFIQVRGGYYGAE